MNNEGLEGSMILEEEIDENYEPTDEEILEYAKFLGMDTDKEKDLFWIAREGLKAPLPSPWKPCQTKEGEIYYFHFETGESQWEHPCDEYYKKMYEKEKIKKRQEKQAAPKKETTKAAASKPAAKATVVEAYDPVPVSKPSKLALKKKETLAYMDSYQDKKANDPLLKAQQEKKINQYKDEKEQELKTKKDKLDKEFEEKRRQAEEDHRKALDTIEKKYQDMKKKEENKLKDEYKPLEEKDIPRERAKYTEELQEELEEELENKLEKHKESLELELSNIKTDYEKKRKEKIKELTEKISRKYKDTIEDLEVEVSKLRAASLSDDMYKDDGTRMKESLLKTFIKEQESKFELEKENLKKQISQETRALKVKEDQKFQEEVNKLYKEFEQETKDKGGFDEERYKNGLEIDLKAKLEQYKTQVNRKFEIMKLNSLEKLKDYERQKMEAFRNNIGSELEYLETDFDKEKANLEAQFSKDKLRAEQKVKEDISAYRDLSMKKLEEKKKQLENEKFEKLNMLKIKLSTLKGVNEHDIKNTEEKLNQMESKMKNFQSTLDAKQDEYRKEFNLGEKLLSEVAELENLLSNSSPTKNTNAMDLETRKKVEQLNKILEQKNQQIEQLKNEKSKTENYTSSNAFGTEIYETTNLAVQPETESFELDKIHFDLEQIKKFVRSQANREDVEYIDDNYDNDEQFRNQYRNYYVPAGKDKDVTFELGKDRKVLEKKRAQLMRDLQMVNNDKEQYRGDREKQEFLRHVKKLIQKKLTSVNSQLDYLLKLSGKIDRSISVDKGGQRSYMRHSQNNYVEDTNSEAFSEDYEIS